MYRHAHVDKEFTVLIKNANRVVPPLNKSFHALNTIFQIGVVFKRIFSLWRGRQIYKLRTALG